MDTLNVLNVLSKKFFIFCLSFFVGFELKIISRGVTGCSLKHKKGLTALSKFQHEAEGTHRWLIAGGVFEQSWCADSGGIITHLIFNKLHFVVLRAFGCLVASGSNPKWLQISEVWLGVCYKLQRLERDVAGFQFESIQSSK